MASTTSTYYGLTRVRESSPGSSDWAATDGNFEIISMIMKAIEQHHHGSAAGILPPGYNVSDPSLPTNPTLTVQNTTGSGGVLTPGTSIGVRLSYTDGNGLETAASPEQDCALPVAVVPPLTPTLVSTTPTLNALSGGVYIYALTKTSASGETTISNVLAVPILFDQTYEVEIGFSAINSYTDGTVGLNLYRAAGQSSAFQLVTSVTSTSQTTYTDTNSTSTMNQNVQPPATSTFNATYNINIDWSVMFPPPSAAAFINVYVTQQPGVWPANSLLTQLALPSISPPTEINYYGSETLGQGTPNNGSEVVSGPPLVQIGTETTFGTTNIDFGGYQALNFRLGNSAGVPADFSTPHNGDMYYDSSTSPPTIRAYINSTWTNWGTTSATAYSHPAQETGGHITAHIPFNATAGISTYTILSSIVDSTAGTPIQATPISLVSSGGSSATTSSSTSATITDMSGTIVPSFNDQWFEFTLSFQVSGDTAGMTISFGIAVGQGTPTPTMVLQGTRGAYINAVGQSIHAYTTCLVQLPTSSSPITTTFQGWWWVSGGGTATCSSPNRFISAKGLW